MNAKELSWRAGTIVGKWTIIAVLVYYLWYFKLFWFIFVGIPFLITYEAGLIIEYGIQPVLTYHWQWWTAAICSIIFLIIFEYYTHYRHKRRDLRIGDELEGRVVWAKGSGEGLIYDVWDLKNYLRWKFGKKKGKGSKTRNSSKNTDEIPGTSPFEIPLGPPTTDDYIIYFKRSYFQIIPSKLYIDRKLGCTPTFFCFWTDNLKMIRVPHPTRPGLFVWRLTTGGIEQYDTDYKGMTQENRKLLGRSQAYVNWALRSDPETQKTDYTKGSFPLRVLEPEEGEFD